MKEFEIGEEISSVRLSMNYGRLSAETFLKNGYIEQTERRHEKTNLRNYVVVKKLPGEEEYIELRNKTFTFSVGFALKTGFEGFEHIESSVRNLCTKWPERIRSDPRYLHFFATLKIFESNKFPEIPNCLNTDPTFICLPNLREFPSAFFFKDRHKVASDFLYGAREKILSLLEEDLEAYNKEQRKEILEFCEKLGVCLENLSHVKYISAFDQHNNKIKRPLFIQRSIWRAKKQIEKFRKLNRENK